jgi:hypothetical protein
VEEGRLSVIWFQLLPREGVKGGPVAHDLYLVGGGMGVGGEGDPLALLKNFH